MASQSFSRGTSSCETRPASTRQNGLPPVADSTTMKRETHMPAQPNIGAMHRLVYVAGGVVLLAWGFFFIDTGWLKWAMPLGGAGMIIEGTIGY